MGISEVLAKLSSVWRALSALRHAAAQRKPEAAVLIDFPDFHAVLARTLRRQAVPLIYYVSPQVWAWRPGRARVIARRARLILTLFSFETEIYRRLGADVVWTGHPIVDDVAEGLAGAPAAAGPRPRLALLPGSRPAEVRRLWPLMRDAAAHLAARRPLDVFAVQAPGFSDASYPGARDAGIALVASGAHPLLASAELAWVASGTATLETALCRTPMVVVYRASRMSFAVGRRLVKVPWISLVNIVAGETVVPELLQEELTPERLLEESQALLDSPERRTRMRADLERVARELGPPGASRRAAEAVAAALDANRTRPARTAAQ